MLGRDVRVAEAPLEWAREVNGGPAAEIVHRARDVRGHPRRMGRGESQRGPLLDGARDPVDAWLASRPRVVERIDQTMTDFRAATAIDLAMLTVASRQLRALVES